MVLIGGDMLRRAEDVRITYERQLLHRRGWVVLAVGQMEYRMHRAKRSEFEENVERSGRAPMRCGTIRERIYWRYQGRYFWDNDGLTQNQVHALLAARQAREQERIQRAQIRLALDGSQQPAFGTLISEDAMQAVWARDDGRCRQCGGATDLVFDYVIPVAFGGASSADNLQILCEPCTRNKAAGLGVQ